MKNLTLIILFFLFSFNVCFSQDSLKDIFGNAFTIGTAVSYKQASGEDEPGVMIMKKHFNSITPENMLKWGPVHPQSGEYNFSNADNFVALGKKFNAEIIGHTLVWHQQTPQWVFENEKGGPLEKDALIKRMEDHIETVMGRYKGQIKGWDVLNEALEDDGRLRASPWFEIAGRDYIYAAFKKAQQVDPKAELYYNDYNMYKPEKRDAAIGLAKEIRALGGKIDGIGMQGHYMLETPSIDMIEASILEIHQAGFKVMITELDVDVLPRPSGAEGADLDRNFAEDEKFNPYRDGLPEEVQEKLAKRYADLFALFYKHRDKISRVTFWGVHDGATWLNNWPVRGRTNYPLLFDRDFQIKEEVINEIKERIKKKEFEMR